MVKVTSMTNTDSNPNSYKVSLFADTKAEVATAEIVGLPEDATIEMGSTCMTASGEMAYRKSDGSWNWLG